MIFKREIFTYLLLILTISFVYGNDSVVVRKSLFLIPHPAYQQETSWSAGVAGGYYFKSNDLSRISSISGSADYTLLNQFLFNITPKIFFPGKKWYLYSNLNFRNYPDFYYGIGNKPTEIKQSFTSNVFSLNLQPQYEIKQHFLIGPYLTARYESIKPGSGFEQIREKIYNDFGSEGWEKPFYKVSLGALATYDSRDNQFYPLKGIFAKSTFSVSKAGWGSSYSIMDFTLDVRQYIAFYGENVFAWQFFFESATGNSAIPFQLLPTLGGIDYMRGFRKGMYRDNFMALLQTEYRIPLYKRLKAAVFFSAGDVFNDLNLKTDKFKAAYGCGLRYRLNDARVHLRVDVAKNNYGEKLQFYITATEAF